MAILTSENIFRTFFEENIKKTSGEYVTLFSKKVKFGEKKVQH